MDLAGSQVSALTAIGAVALATLAFLGTTGCSPDTTATDTAGTTTSHDSTTEDSTTIDESSESGMTSTETDDGDEPDDTDWSGGSFYAGPTDRDFIVSGCDPWIQDCPEGEKCVPYASTGGTWDENKCVPITGDDQPGEACSYNGVIEGTDSCDGSGICWNVIEVDGELLGTCTPFCTGTPDVPECAEGASCLVANQGSITLCIEACDPLAQDCPDGLSCTWVGEQFACVPGNDDPPNQPCDDIPQCPEGSVCVMGELVDGCAGSACCTAFCSISEPNCVEPTSECVAFLEDPPAGLEDVGICVSP